MIALKRRADFPPRRSAWPRRRSVPVLRNYLYLQLRSSKDGSRTTRSARALRPIGHAARELVRFSAIENILITDSKQIDPVLAAENLPPASAIILRDYDLSYTERFKLGLQLKKICREKDLPLLVAKDVKLARALNADGMHFPEFMLAEARRIKTKRPKWLVTVAAHSKAKTITAYNSNVDAVLISPIYKTSSHSHQKPLGLYRAKLFIYKDQPAYALGGVSLHHKKLLKHNGFYGFAGINWVKDVVKSPQSLG